MIKRTKQEQGNIQTENVKPKLGEIAPKSLRDRLSEEQRRLEKIWRQDPTRLWRSR